MIYLITALAIYFLIVFVALRFVVPFMGFNALRASQEIPQEIKDRIAKLEKASQTPEEYLKRAYDLVVSRWHAGRFETLLRAPLAFRKDLAQVWRSPGYAHCTTQNYLLFVLLVGSKFFRPEDIKKKTVLFNFFVHQFLQVHVANQWLDVDPAGASICGMPFGSHISFFG